MNKRKENHGYFRARPPKGAPQANYLNNWPEPRPTKKGKGNHNYFQNNPPKGISRAGYLNDWPKSEPIEVELTPVNLPSPLNDWYASFEIDNLIVIRKEGTIQPAYFLLSGLLDITNLMSGLQWAHLLIEQAQRFEDLAATYRTMATIIRIKNAKKRTLKRK